MVKKSTLLVFHAFNKGNIEVQFARAEMIKYGNP
jgi:hypothetical protein